MTIAFVGSGNMTYQLVNAFSKSNKINIAGIYSRNKYTAEAIASDTKVPIIGSIDSLKADVIFLCVKDDAINEVSRALNKQNSVLVHTSGSTPLEAINTASRGVFYPLQTMTRNHLVDFRSLPIFISASNEKDLETLSFLANEIGEKVHVVDEEQRKHLHIAAVLTNNFINHLAVKANDYLQKHDLDYEMIVPLLQTTLEKLTQKPYNFQQTGPAKREDHNVINSHLALLESDPHLYQIYQDITKSIISHENHT